MWLWVDDLYLDTWTLGDEMRGCFGLGILTSISNSVMYRTWSFFNPGVFRCHPKAGLGRAARSQKTVAGSSEVDSRADLEDEADGSRVIVAKGCPGRATPYGALGRFWGVVILAHIGGSPYWMAVKRRLF